MAWSAVELADFVKALATDDYKTVATMVSKLAQRMDRVVEEAAQAANNVVSAVAEGRLPGIPRLIEAGREIDVSFQVSETDPALVIYSFEEETTAPLLSSEVAYIDLLADADDPPTTIVGSTGLGSTQLLGLVGAGITNTPRGQIVAWIPAGHHVLMSKTGSGDATLIHAVELVFGS